MHHQHRSDYAALHRMAHGYGVGLGAYLANVLSGHPRLAGAFLHRVPAVVRHLASRKSEKPLGPYTFRMKFASPSSRVVSSGRSGRLLRPSSTAAHSRAVKAV